MATTRIRTCGTMPVHRRLLNEDPNYRAARSRIENLARRSARAREPLLTAPVVVPVVVHVVRFTGEQNVSEGQIRSQLDAINRDFSGANEDLELVPQIWRPLLTNTNIRFALATEDPDGNPTDGINRVSTSVASFVDDDAVKFSAQGGTDAWPADRYLNMWVCPLQDLLGYAQFPGGPAATDGVVIDFRAFGDVGTAEPPFDLGRTAVHEVGHWLNLFHIWGDDGTGCNGTDNVDDTPNQAEPNTGRPVFPHITCDNGPNGDMFVNFMDYTDDAGMVMFTAGQVTRMQATIIGPRASLQQSGSGPSGPSPGWRHADLTAATGAPDAAGDPVVLPSADGMAHVLYRGTDGHIHELRSVARPVDAY